MSPGRKLKILAVDDHPILRDGLAAIINGQVDMEIVGEASDGAEAIVRFDEVRPDITLMDLQMPVMGGIEAIQHIRRKDAKARFIVLTTYEGDVQALRALKAGAAGYLLKSSLRRELVETIRAIHSGRRHVPPEIAQEIALHAAQDPLTDREVAVLKGVASGQSNKEIAWQFSITEDTIKAHMKTIFGKLDVSDRTLAVTVAMRRGYFG